MKKDGTVDELTKKEGLMLERELEKLELTLGGIANMTRIPGAIFVVDTIKEHIAINEAVKLNIPIISMVDTNSDPDIPDHIIPSNDDSARTIQLVTAQIADAIIEGNAEREAIKEEELMEEAAAEAKKDTGSDSDKEEKKEVKAGKSTKRRKRRRKTSDSDSKDQAAESAKDQADESAKEDDKKEEEKESDSDKE